MRRGSNLLRVGDFNQTVVLDVIRRSAQGVSRAQVARATGLSAQTITNVCRRLIEQELVLEDGALPPSGPGRPASKLRLNPGGRYVVGVHLDPAVMTYVILDLAGTVVARVQRPIPHPDPPSHVVEGIAADIRRLIDSAGVERGRVIGIGIASPGPLDRAAGVVVDPPHLTGWGHVPLREAVADLTGLPVVLDKDVLAAAAAHVWTSAGGGSANFVFFYLGTGIAISIVLGDEVIRGVSGNAGESGHLVVDPDGPPCGCGMRGCLGACLSTEALVHQMLEAGLPVPFEVDPRDARQGYRVLGELGRHADAGDDRALRLLRLAARRLAVAAAHTSDLMDVDTVILGGPAWHLIQRHALGPMREALRELRTLASVHPVSVRSSEIGVEVASVGAACGVLQRAFAPTAQSLLIDQAREQV